MFLFHKFSSVLSIFYIFQMKLSFIYESISVIKFWYEWNLFYDGEEVRDYKKLYGNIKF